MTLSEACRIFGSAAPFSFFILVICAYSFFFLDSVAQHLFILLGFLMNQFASLLVFYYLFAISLNYLIFIIFFPPHFFFVQLDVLFLTSEDVC